MEGKLKTNVVYFTTRCNLLCTYCYQHLEDYSHKETQREELKKIAEETIEREGEENQTLFVLFGGEPTLRWSDVKFFMDYAFSLKKDVQFNIVTNGIKFKNDSFLKDFLNNNHYKEGRLKLEISFDGIGNFERIYPDKKDSTEDIIGILFKLKEINTKYNIRYTVHKNNIENLQKDLLKIMKFFNPERIILSEFESDLTPIQLEKLEEVKKILIDKYYNTEINVPICMKKDEMCEVCGKCEKNINKFSLNLGKENITKNKIGFGKFNDFNDFDNLIKDENE